MSNFDPFQKGNNKKEKEKLNKKFDPFNVNKQKETNNNSHERDTKIVKEKEKQKSNFDPFKTTKILNNDKPNQKKSDKEFTFLKKETQQKEEIKKKRFKKRDSSEEEEEEIEQELREKLKIKQSKQTSDEEQFNYFKKHEEKQDELLGIQTASNQVDLLAIGVHCPVESCNKLDFLPFTCEFCNVQFCQEHWKPEKHECKIVGKLDRRIYDCEKCKHEIQVNVGQDPREIMEKHLKSGCKFAVKNPKQPDSKTTKTTRDRQTKGKGKRQIQNQNQNTNKNKNKRGGRGRGRRVGRGRKDGKGENSKKNFGNNAKSNDQNTPPQKESKFYACRFKDCSQKEIFEIKCPDCNLNFCLKHRNTLMHECQGSQPKKVKKKVFYHKKKKLNQKQKKKMKKRKRKKKN
ncbi:an1-type zinc finger protein [Anaeramoeba flamelloides]|uniref:An1-type zinc finger protein n=1 Tax=Anaeramoeba flamelloides TaxID=1746091 RepID=A0ABQ8Y8B1_9EUKA|nr:an1-type zinc finger protein [Anaeramoeba flamelloides]